MPKKYNIAIDVSPLVDSNSIRGVGYYTQQLVQAIQELISSSSHYQHFQVTLVKNLSDNISQKFDLVHYPFFDPFFLTLPIRFHIPTVITIHDLIPLQFPSQFPVGLRGQIKWQIQRYLARHSAAIITVSKYSQSTIAKILKYPQSKIFVTYEAGDPTYQKKYSTTQLQKVRQKYNLPPKFVLNNGDLNWNKNIPNLVKACISLKYPLVIVGKQAVDINKLNLEKISIFRPYDLFRHLLNIPSPQLKHIKILKKLFNNPLIQRPGYVPDEDLPMIYQLATIYCQPSYAEGFGLSVIKAFQSHTPVVFSNQTSLPEIARNYGLSFDPYQPNDLENKLKLLWSQPKKCQLLAQTAYDYSQQFSWLKTATQTLKIYQSILDHGQ